MEHVLRRHDPRLEGDGSSRNKYSSVNVDGGDKNEENDTIFDSSRSEFDDDSSEDLSNNSSRIEDLGDK